MSDTMRHNRAAVWLVIVACLLCGPGALRGADWPQWRGPSHDGVSPETWRWDGENASPGRLAWEANVGEGGSSVIVVGGRLYALGWADGQDHLTCLDAATGEQVWRQSYACPRYGRRALGDQNQYSGPTSTPTFDRRSGLLYTLSTDGDLIAWDANRGGAQVWAINLYDQYDVPRRPDVGGGHRDYGYTTAPLLHGDLLLVAVGGPVGLVVAFDLQTGDQRWASENRDPAANAGGMAPLEVDGASCVAVLSIHRLVVMRTDSGHEGQTVASHPWETHFVNSLVTPTVIDQDVVVSSGYNISRMVRLRIEGDAMRPVWESRQFTAVGSPVVYKGKIYTPYRRLRCFDAATGELEWEGGVFGVDGSCLVTADGRLVVWGNGRLAIVDTADHSPGGYTERAVRDDLFRPNNGWPHVTLAGGRVYGKDRFGKLLCFEPEE